MARLLGTEFGFEQVWTLYDCSCSAALALS
jgi:hypothetical protein